MNTPIGFDSHEQLAKAENESRIQLVNIKDKDGNNTEYIVLKFTQSNLEDAPHRSEINQLQMFPQYRSAKPEDFIQYTVMTKDKFNSLLKKASDLLPSISMSVPSLPSDYSNIDHYTLQRIHSIFATNYNITLYFNPKEKYFFAASQDMQTPPEEKLIEAAEIVSIAHRLPSFPLISFLSWQRYELNSVDFQYIFKDITQPSEPFRDRVRYNSLFKTNQSFYTPTSLN